MIKMQYFVCFCSSGSAETLKQAMGEVKN